MKWICLNSTAKEQERGLSSMFIPHFYLCSGIRILLPVFRKQWAIIKGIYLPTYINTLQSEVMRTHGTLTQINEKWQISACKYFLQLPVFHGFCFLTFDLIENDFHWQWTPIHLCIICISGISAELWSTLVGPAFKSPTLTCSCWQIHRNTTFRSIRGTGEYFRSFYKTFYYWYVYSLARRRM